MSIFRSIFKINIFFVLIFFSLPVLASGNDDNPWYVSRDLLIKNKTYFELFGGGVYPIMSYSEKSFSQDKAPCFLYDFGGAIRFQRGKWFSFSPRLTYMGQGVAMDDDLDYRLRINYISFTFPVELQVYLHERMNKSVSRLFFFAGPYVATPVSSRLLNNSYSKWLTFSEVKKLNLGGEVGVGFRIPTYSLEGSSNIELKLSYLRGFLDTYTNYEKNLADPDLRSQLYINNGKRFNSAIKLTVGIEIPKKTKKYVSFTAGGDGKKRYKKVVVVDEK